VRPRFVAAHKFRIAAALVVAAGFAACGSEEAAPPVEADAGVEDSALATAICPAIAPPEDPPTPCTLPEGTTCDFGLCGTVIAQCTGGLWRFGKNRAPNPTCPEQAPVTDAPCPECWPGDKTCNYGSEDCSSPDASVNQSVAACVNGTWTLEVRPCRDAGPDVQGDAALDGD
jgi:hypothetical protein